MLYGIQAGFGSPQVPVAELLARPVPTLFSPQKPRSSNFLQVPDVESPRFVSCELLLLIRIVHFYFQIQFIYQYISKLINIYATSKNIYWQLYNSDAMYSSIHFFLIIKKIIPFFFYNFYFFINTLYYNIICNLNLTIY